MGRDKIDLTQDVKATFTQISFYWPDSLKEAWDEFNKIVTKKSKFSKLYPERVNSYAIRRLIMMYIYNNTTNEEIKKKLTQFRRKEDAYYLKHIQKHKERKIQEKLREQNGDNSNN